MACSIDIFRRFSYFHFDNPKFNINAKAFFLGYIFTSSPSRKLFNLDVCSGCSMREDKIAAPSTLPELCILTFKQNVSPSTVLSALNNSVRLLFCLSDKFENDFRLVKETTCPCFIFADVDDDGSGWNSSVFVEIVIKPSSGNRNVFCNHDSFRFIKSVYVRVDLIHCSISEITIFLMAQLNVFQHLQKN